MCIYCETATATGGTLNPSNGIPVVNLASIAHIQIAGLIVHEMAERGPIDANSLAFRYYECADCHAITGRRQDFDDPVNHESFCLWRRSVELYPPKGNADVSHTS